MKLSDVITISPGFQRSVNVKHDMADPSKISGYIPTEKAETVLHHFLRSVRGDVQDNAYMLIGSYGTGKSHLVTVMASLVGKKVPSDSFDPVLDKLICGELKALFAEEKDRTEPYLVVTLSGSSELQLDDHLLYGLKQALLKEALEVPVPTSYALAQKTIRRWREEYPNVYLSFKDMLPKHRYASVESILSDLKEFNSDALELFTDLYPKLTAGARFEFYGGNVADIYQEVCRELGSKGYRGILLVYDEFNKLLDSSLRHGEDLKTLQDLAELASRSDETGRFHMCLVSHRTIGQYVAELGDVRADEWRKIEGRFKIFDVSNKPWETYDLMGRVLQKKRPEYLHDLLKKNELWHNRLESVFDGLSRDTIQEKVVEGCFPLHPLSVYMLPRISAKLGQNERTLFTFLTGGDNSPLPGALDRELDDVQHVYPWEIYDYFEPVLRRSKDSDLKSTWMRVTNTVESLPEEAVRAVRLAKTIGAFEITGSSFSLPCTAQLVKYAMGNLAFDEAIGILTEKKMVYISESTDEISIVEPADIDIEQEIEEWASKDPRGYSLDRLVELGIQDYIIPHRYNHLEKITRFLTPLYVNIDNLDTAIPQGRFPRELDGLDGIICYMFPENSQQRQRLVEVASESNDSRIVFAVPKDSVSLTRTLKRFLALSELTEVLPRESQDPRVAKLLTLYLDDARETLTSELGKVTNPSGNVEYYLETKQIAIETRQQLSDLASRMMDRLYPEAPEINNELINKQSPTTTSRRARNQVIDELLKGSRTVRKKLRSSQEAFMFDTVFIKTGLYDEEREEFTAGESCEQVMAEFDSFFKQASSASKRFGDLLQTLVRPPFGLREGIIPALMVVPLVKYKEYVTVRDSSGQDMRIDSGLLDRIMDSPDSYTLQLEEWDEAFECVTSGIAGVFQFAMPTDVFFANRFQELGDEILRWFMGLPRFARETNNVTLETRIFRRCAKIAGINTKRILLKELPDLLGYTSYDIHDAQKIIEVVDKAKAELEAATDRLAEDVESKFFQFLQDYGTEDETLVSLARNAAEVLMERGTPSIEWMKLLDYTIQYNGHDDRLFAIGLARILSGVRLEDWYDETVAQFDSLLQELASASKEVVATHHRLSAKVELLFVDSAGDDEKVVFQQCEEVSDVGMMLQSSLESTIENFGEAITSLERKQIILNILRKYL